MSERFLLDVLTKKRFAEAMPSRGLRLIGALFTAPIDLPASSSVGRFGWINAVHRPALKYARLGRFSHSSVLPSRTRST